MAAAAARGVAAGAGPSSRRRGGAAAAGRAPPAAKAGRGLGQRPAPPAVAAEVAAPPESLEGGIAQVREVLRGAFAGKRRGKGKGKAAGSARGSRLIVEFPLMDESPEALVDVVASMLEEAALLYPAEVRFASPAAAALAECQTIADAEAPGVPGAVLVAVGPAADDVPALSALVSRAGWAGVVLINPGFTDAAQVLPDYQAFVRTFQVMYSLLPLSIQGLMGSTTEGAVFRCVTAPVGAAAAVPWTIFIQKGGEFTIAGKMAGRPGNKEIEDTFYNQMAKDSIVNQGIAGLRQNLGKAAGSIAKAFKNKE